MNENACVIAVCGRKNVGKTTLIEKIAADLCGRGYRIAYMKHDGHEFTPDVPGTDSDRIRKTGVEATVVFSARQCMIVRQQKPELKKLLDQFADYDLVLYEGGKDTPLPKLEIIRAAISTAPVSVQIGRLGIITDIADFAAGGEPTFLLHDTKRISSYFAEYIEKHRQKTDTKKRDDENEG